MLVERAEADAEAGAEAGAEADAEAGAEAGADAGAHYPVLSGERSRSQKATTTSAVRGSTWS